MNKQLSFSIVNKDSTDKMLVLIQQLNPNRERNVLKQRLEQMLDCDSYKCFGLYKEDILIGLVGCWISFRLYTGKHLELDNVIINNKIQSKGYGKIFFGFIENWAKKNSYDAIGLNTYVENNRSHKFYFNHGYKILGFNFQKQLNKTN